MPSRKMTGRTLRASEFLTLSPVEAQAIIEPSLATLHARLRARQHVAIYESPDFDTCMRLLDQATIEYLEPQAVTCRQLLHGLEKQSKKGGDHSATTRKAKAIKWHTPARKLLREEERKDKTRREPRSAAALAISVRWGLTQMKKIRVPTEGTIQDFILKERKSKTLQIGDIEPA